MRINSEFRDYYDSVQSEGQDQSLVYQRHKRTEKLMSYPFPNFGISRYGDNYLPFKIDSHAIGFCGKVYLCLEFNHRDAAYAHDKESRDKRRYCYTIQDIDRVVEEFCDNDQKAYYNRKKNARSYSNNRSTFERYLAEAEALGQSHARWDKYFIENQCPVFVAHYKLEYEQGGYKLASAGEISYHAPLKFYDFMKVFPPFQAFQEINMWLSNQAVPIKPIPEIPDKVMLEVKGFDKFSFRKPKTSEKRKK